MQEFAIGLNDNGDLVYIYDDSLSFLQDLGKASVRRASHVEPTEDGKWTADMSPVNGPVLGPFPLRKDALESEVEFLKGVLF